MIRRFLHTLLLIGSALPLGVSAGLTQPEPAEPVTTEYNSGYTAGFSDGRIAGHADCRFDPASCAINLTNVLPPAEYGETEPNDTGISADVMALETNVWGQSYSTSDQDWYYVVTNEPNYNLTLNFALPNLNSNNCQTRIDPDSGELSLQCNCIIETRTNLVSGTEYNYSRCSLAGWTVSIRNAVGLTLTEFNTNFTSVEHATSGISYRTTLGMAGMYYIVVKPVVSEFNYQPYTLVAKLEPSPNNTLNFAGGRTNAEIEPNNTPSEATVITRGVSEFGLINLRFDATLCNTESCEYLQNEDDWFVYNSPGNEVVQLGFCDLSSCSAGDWLVQIFDVNGIYAIQWQGIDPDLVTPLMAFNTNTTPVAGTTNVTPSVWQIGLGAPGPYYMRIGHKRKLEAACVQWSIDQDNNGLPDSNQYNCACDDGSTSCELNILNPGAATTDTVEQVIWPVCPNGEGGGEDSFCPSACVCINEADGCSLYQSDIDGDGLPGPNAAPCRCNPTGVASCDITIQNPGTPTVIAIPDQTVYPLCPDGSGGNTSPQCTVGCRCTNYAGFVEIPENFVTSQYNFTWNTTPFGSPQ